MPGDGIGTDNLDVALFEDVADVASLGVLHYRHYTLTATRNAGYPLHAVRVRSCSVGVGSR